MSDLNITVTDQSPAFAYLPNREDPNAWQSSWTGSPDSSYDATHTQNNIPQGTSSHVVALSGASAQITFVGSAVTIYGEGTANAYTTTLDNGSSVPGAPAGSMLATYGGLNGTATHTLLLKTTQSTQLSLTYATFTVRSDIAANSVTNTTQVAVTVGANGATTTNPFFTTSGGGFSNQHIDDGYTRIDSNSANAQISFTCSNTSTLLIYGTTNYNHGTFSVEIDPPAGASQGARVFNGTSKWFDLDLVVFFETGMDPTQQYQVKMTNLVSNDYTDIHSVVMMNLPAELAASSSASGSASKSTSSAPTTPSKASSGTGKTVGIAVGVVVVVAALALFAFWFRRRNAQERRKKTRIPMDGMVTPFAHPPVTPFVDTPHSKDTSFSGTEAPMSLSNFRQHPGNTSYGDNSTYGGGAYPANTYATNSAAGSTQDLRGVGKGSRHNPQYSDLSGSEDFNPYADGSGQSSGLAFLQDSSYAGSAIGPGSRPPSNHLAGPTQGSSQGSSRGGSAGISQPYRPPEKGPVPTDTASARVRHEVDAGRVPDEEVLPPSYNPTWQTS
ncbi:hypothetical protein K438DRAFT_2016928 [Mycena galopus ATCC 62051]|nr:hypothetical protein K438DRAFT_2016928 [Mycena galopus ATCC 62051]